MRKLIIYAGLLFASVVSCAEDAEKPPAPPPDWGNDSPPVPIPQKPTPVIQTQRKGKPEPALHGQALADAVEKARLNVEEKQISADKLSALPPSGEKVYSIGDVIDVNGVLLKIIEAHTGKVPLKDFRERETASADDLLWVKVSLFNTSDTKKSNYESWAKQFSFLNDHASTTDDLGNSYKRINFEFTTKVVDHTDGDSIYPEKGIVDVLVFEIPIPKAQYIDLLLPLENIDKAKGKVTFRLKLK